MDDLQPFLPILAFVAAVAVVAAAVRGLRSIYLRRVTLHPEMIRQLQIEITEAARQASIQPGMLIDLDPFWRRSGIKEPDRRAVVHPLVDSRVFGWIETREADGFTQFLAAAGRAIWLPTKRRVVVSQWVTDRSSQGTPVTLMIENVLGSVVLGDQDNSYTEGHRAGGHVVEGDMVGRNKAVDGDVHDIEAGGNVVGSGNSGYSETTGPMTISTLDELSSALLALRDDARARGESAAVVDALSWASTMAHPDRQPDVREHATHQRALHGAGAWARTGISAIVEGVTGALASHWLLEALRT